MVVMAVYQAQSTMRWKVCHLTAPTLLTSSLLIVESTISIKDRKPYWSTGSICSGWWDGEWWPVSSTLSEWTQTEWTGNSSFYGTIFRCTSCLRGVDGSCSIRDDMWHVLAETLFYDLMIGKWSIEIITEYFKTLSQSPYTIKWSV